MFEILAGFRKSPQNLCMVIQAECKSLRSSATFAQWNTEHIPKHRRATFPKAQRTLFSLDLHVAALAARMGVVFTHSFKVAAQVAARTSKGCQ